MTTLTESEFEDIRDATGANDTDEYSDAKIQARYDDAVTNATAIGNSALIFPYTYVYVLRRLWGIRSIAVDRYTDHGDHEIRSQVRDATLKLLQYWEKYTGLTGGIGGGLQISTLNLDIDYDCDDLEAGL